MASRRTTARRRSSSRSMRKLRRCGPGRWEVFTHGGRKPHRHRRDRMGDGRSEAPGRRRNPADQHGSRRREDRASTSALTRAVASDAVSIPVIASGGVGTLAASGRWREDRRRRRRRGARREHLPQRRIHRGPGQAGACATPVWKSDERDACDGSYLMDSVSESWLNKVNWSSDGLIPVIAQEVGTNKILTLAWMNRDALRQTAEQTKEAVYWSRLAQESSGAKARNRDTCRPFARSCSIATRTRSCSRSSRWAASPAIPVAPAVSSSGSRATPGSNRRRC